jgi:hypothetical protein
VPGIHYRDEAYEKIFRVALRANDRAAAREVADLWRVAGADTEIVGAWLHADEMEEAMEFARKLSTPSARVSALLIIVQEALDRAGAPNF